MSERIDFTELRASLEYMVARPWEFGVDGLHGVRTYLALVEAVEAARTVSQETWFQIRSEGSAKVLYDALARFDFEDGRAV